ncbi:hypothetical protein [uncultured Methanobrevibacter sp.]|uniref:hypothetical protein n=1 Tax=uncultured Methanobrevibacter sp. TaxID=253161 RepID=UPI0025FB8032|nr:hypothetical protein [uncultured Methanobrevibacter sp.]
MKYIQIGMKTIKADDIVQEKDNEKLRKRNEDLAKKVDEQDRRIECLEQFLKYLKE